MGKLESKFQKEVKDYIKARLPGAFVLKMDPNEIQGIPDLLVLYNDKWAMLEVKRAANASKRPNQDHYVDIMDEMSYASFIYPENKEEVLDELQCTLQSKRKARVSKRKQQPLD